MPENLGLRLGRQTNLVMVTLDNYPGIKVEVLVDDIPLQEYDDNGEHAPKTISRYIEAQSGKDFAVKLTCTVPLPNQYGLEWAVNIDGAPGRCQAYHPKRAR